MSSFNPLHCGAVVASISKTCRLAGVATFQSPSLRGSGRFHVQEDQDRDQVGVSIPFIAGQWSLHMTERLDVESRIGFNPLHCGAVVASGRRPGRPNDWLDSFNPLHCGAVVASAPASAQAQGGRLFQSPSLRGSGRFSYRFLQTFGIYRFQSPSLRGSGRFNCP